MSTYWSVPDRVRNSTTFQEQIQQVIMADHSSSTEAVEAAQNETLINEDSSDEDVIEQPRKKASVNGILIYAIPNGDHSVTIDNVLDFLYIDEYELPKKDVNFCNWGIRITHAGEINIHICTEGCLKNERGLCRFAQNVITSYEHNEVKKCKAKHQSCSFVNCVYSNVYRADVTQQQQETEVPIHLMKSTKGNADLLVTGVYPKQEN